MKKSFIKIILAILAVATVIPASFAGNEQRVGEAGASYLLINPWAMASLA
jgi:hypothetical protein